MREVDYIVVGCGLASIAFCEQLRTHHKSFVVFDDKSQKSSIVAAGLYNPIILKRFTAVWKAKIQLDIAIPVYKKIENDFNIIVDYKLKILRRFSSIEEQNQWFTASDKPVLETYLSTQIIKNNNDSVDAPFGFGEVLHSGRIDTEALIFGYKEFLKSHDSIQDESFVYDKLEIKDSYVQYKDVNAKNVVFAEGFGVKKNPFFNNIPLNGTKGEVLTIKAAGLKLDYAIKSSVFIIPLGNDLYTVGSTYDWKDKTNIPTEAAKEELVSKLRKFIKADFDVVSHVAGIRPTVNDRRPLVGRHLTYSNLYVLNGLGTRGVMVAPYAAQELYRYIENGDEPDSDININRFTS